MMWDSVLRAIGIIGIIGAYGLFVSYGSMTYPLMLAIIGIIALVSPDVISELPFGPSK